MFLQIKREMSNSEDVEQLVSITGVDRNVAENLLEACGGEAIVHPFLSTKSDDEIFVCR